MTVHMYMYMYFFLYLFTGLVISFVIDTSEDLLLAIDSCEEVDPELLIPSLRPPMLNYHPLV